MRWFLASTLAVAALVAIVLFARRSSAPAQAPLEQPAARTPPPAQPAVAPEPMVLEAPSAGGREQNAIDPGSIEFPGARVESAVDEKSAPVKLRGTLKDENTNQPLPEFDLEFEVVSEVPTEGPQRKVGCRTDAKGQFQCADPILVARCVVRFLDRPGHKRLIPPWTVELEDVRKGELALVVPWGPTYRLAFAPEGAVEPANVELRLRSTGLRGQGNNSTEWEPAHAGDPPWVRFQPLLGDSGKVQKIEARTRDGLWSGSAEASTASGLAPGVTLVTFEPRAVLDGTVSDEEKQPLADVDILLDARDSGERPLRRAARTGPDGHFRFDQLPACMGELRVTSVRHAPWAQGVTLIAGQAQELPVVLSSLALAGRLQVRVESESGKYAPPFALVLTLENDTVAEAGGERFVRRLPAQWSEESGRKVAHFLFPDLPGKSFRVRPQKDDFFVWDPPQLTLQPPAEEARILIHDGAPNASLAFRVKDAQTGEALSAFELTLEFPGGTTAPRRMGAHSGQAFLEHLPLERALGWRVEAPDHAPALGTLADFQLSEPREDGELRVCELELRPGWGEAYRFLDARNRGPLAGIEVLLDGVAAGVSDEHGELLVRAPARPARIEYQCAERGIALRPLQAERKLERRAVVRVAPAPPKKGKG
jgi:Carboxypeptidase regulatory-like domain